MPGGYQVQPDELLRNEYYCSHCESPINDKGYISIEKGIRTRKAKYCQYCDTKAKRDQMDKENEFHIKNNKYAPPEELEAKGDGDSADNSAMASV